MRVGPAITTLFQPKQAPKHCFLLVGDNNVAKINIERLLLSCDRYETSSYANFLASCNLSIRLSCVEFTLAVIEEIYAHRRSSFEIDIERLLFPLTKATDSEASQYLSSESPILQTIAAFWAHPDFQSNVEEGLIPNAWNSFLTIEEAQTIRS